MSLLITKGLGELGGGSLSGLITTQGYGTTKASVYPSCLAFLALGVTPTLTTLDVSMSNAFTISGPAASPSDYTITPLDGGHAVTILSVQQSGPHLLLTTTEHTNGKNYQLTMPSIGIVDINNNPFDGPFTINYVGVGVAPYALAARSIDARTLEITFDEQVDPSTALNPSNYSINNGLTVTGVVAVTNSIYRLSTSRQTQGMTYTVTITNVVDDGGNVT